MTPRVRKGRGKAQATLELIDTAGRILEEIQPATVRAVCYRLFVEKIIPCVDKVNTSRVSRELVWARENGLIPWDYIVDEARRAERTPSWNNPSGMFDACVNQYRKDYWTEQPEWIEVWSEKGTVRGTLAAVLDEYGVTFRVMRGYGSATALHDIAEMARTSDKTLSVIYVGDCDPSGMHMSDIDLPDRLDRYGASVVDIEIVRVAITNEDTTEHAAVPWFPAADKTADQRHRWYVENYGTRCWELDALSPVILRQRVDDEILDRLDVDAWNRCIKIEAVERESLTAYLKGYPGISGQVQKCSP